MMLCGKYLCFFGGIDAQGYVADTWEWDGAQWSQKFPAQSPAARRDHASTFDSARGVTVVTGGTPHDDGFILFDDTWEWDGTDWTEVAVRNKYTANAQHAMAFDRDRGVMIILGHLSGTWSRIWELHRSRVTSHPTNKIAALGASAHFAVAIEATSAASYQWRKDGKPLSDGGRVSGATTSQLTISDVEAADAGSYNVEVSSVCGLVESNSAGLVVTATPIPAVSTWGLVVLSLTTLTAASLLLRRTRTVNTV